MPLRILRLRRRSGGRSTAAAYLSARKALDAHWAPAGWPCAACDEPYECGTAQRARMWVDAYERMLPRWRRVRTR